MAKLKFGLKLNQADLKRVNGKLSLLQKMGDTGVNKALNEEARKIVGVMKSEAPVDTGRLRTNIEYSNRGGSGLVIESSAIDPNTGEDYAPIQEYGGRNIKHTPYFNHNVRKFISNLHANLRKRLQKILKRR